MRSRRSDVCRYGAQNSFQRAAPTTKTITGTSCNVDKVIEREEVATVRENKCASTQRFSKAQRLDHTRIPWQKQHCCAAATFMPQDLASCNFSLFPKLKGVMKGVKFPEKKAIKKPVTKKLQATFDKSNP